MTMTHSNEVANKVSQPMELKKRVTTLEYKKESSETVENAAEAQVV